MKFTQLFTVTALVTLAVATPTPGGGGDGHGTPGPNDSCCKQVTSASDPAAAGIIALLGIIVQGVNVLVGLNCSPITVIGNGNGW